MEYIGCLKQGTNITSETSCTWGTVKLHLYKTEPADLRAPGLKRYIISSYGIHFLTDVGYQYYAEKSEVANKYIRLDGVTFWQNTL